MEWLYISLFHAVNIQPRPLLIENRIVYLEGFISEVLISAIENDLLTDYPEENGQWRRITE
jgi:hypothetical protein